MLLPRKKHLPFFLGALLLTLAGTSVVIASDSMTASQGIAINITGPDSICKKVTNASPTGLSEYIPTNTTAEWQSFVASPPTGVSTASCVQVLVGGVHTDTDCTAAGGSVVTVAGSLVCSMAPACVTSDCRCPSGWTSFSGYTITSPVTSPSCSATFSSWPACTTASHSTFANTPIFAYNGYAMEQCSYRVKDTSGRYCNSARSANAVTVAVACY